MYILDQQVVDSEEELKPPSIGKEPKNRTSAISVIDKNSMLHAA